MFIREKLCKDIIIGIGGVGIWVVVGWRVNTSYSVGGRVVARVVLCLLLVLLRLL